MSGPAVPSDAARDAVACAPGRVMAFVMKKPRTNPATTPRMQRLMFFDMTRRTAEIFASGLRVGWLAACGATR